MDLSQINDIDKLKSLAFDEIQNRDQANRNLQLIGQRIDQITQSQVVQPEEKESAEE